MDACGKDDVKKNCKGQPGMSLKKRNSRAKA
jgi:hypothetical protein